MKKFCSALAILLAWGSMISSSPAQAMMGEKLDLNSLSEAEQAQVQDFVNNEVRADFNENFMDRLKTMSDKTASNEPPMSRETQAVLLKGAYLSLVSSTHLPVSEDKFDRYVGRILDWMRAHYMVPHAITIGALARKTFPVGEGINIGGNYGTEMNFYLRGGKLMSTSYALEAIQGGVGLPVSDVEYYIGFCFGACFGGSPGGYYLGTDVGIGANMFTEVGIDVSSVVQTIFKEHKKFTVKDLYEASTLYMGFGIDIGIDAEAAMGLYRYDQIGGDNVLANPGQALNPNLISGPASQLKP